MERHVSVQDIGSIEFRYSSVNYLVSISPSLRFELSVVPSVHEQFGMSNISAELNLLKVDGGTRYIGRLTSKEPLIRLYPGSSAILYLHLELDHFKLHQIEKLRGGRDLALQINAKFVLEKWGQPQNRGVGSLDNFDFVIPKSDWVEKILPNLNFKDVSLIELPKIQELGNIAKHLNEAWRQHSMRKYDNVLTECRKTLESLSGEVKKRGFIKKENSHPDWEKLLGSKDLEDILGTINQKLHGFLASGAHAGKAINREDADFALLATHGIVTLVTEKLLKMPE